MGMGSCRTRSSSSRCSRATFPLVWPQPRPRRREPSTSQAPRQRRLVSPRRLRQRARFIRQGPSRQERSSTGRRRPFLLHLRRHTLCPRRQRRSRRSFRVLSMARRAPRKPAGRCGSQIRPPSGWRPTRAAESASSGRSSRQRTSTSPLSRSGCSEVCRKRRDGGGSRHTPRRAFHTVFPPCSSCCEHWTR